MPNMILSFLKLFNSMFPKTKLNKTLNIILRLIIVILAYGFIYKQLVYKKDLIALGRDIGQSMNELHEYLLLLLIVLLMLINWGFESLKWQVLIRPIEKISFLKSLKAVFSGVTVSTFTPNRVGEYVGRVFILDKGNLWKAVLSTIIGSMSQLLITVVMGAFGVLFFSLIYKDLLLQLLNIHPTSFVYVYSGFVLLVIIVVVFLILVFLNAAVFVEFFQRYLWGRLKKAIKYLDVIKEYSLGVLVKVLTWSFFRYAIFTLQFYLLLHLFKVHIPYLHAMVLLSLIYLIITVIPTIAITELGIRGSVSIYVIHLYFTYHLDTEADAQLGIVAASSFLWLINLAIPAILGTFFVFRLRFFRNRNNKHKA